MTKIIQPTTDSWCQKVVEIFLRNEPVALPTETVYGLAAPAEREIAVARIYEIKERPSFNPLIMHVKKEWALQQWAEIGPTEEKLIALFWPGPLSLLLPKRNVSDLITAGSDRVVLRAPEHKTFQAVLDEWKGPLVAPSANRSTQLSPTTAQAVVDDLGEALAAVVDGGACEWGVESTIVEVRDGKVVILREGAISKEDFEAKGFSVVNAKSDVHTPGSQLKHYAPKVPLYLLDRQEEWASVTGEDILLLKVLASDAPDEIKGFAVQSLAPDDDLKTAASNLFDFLRQAQTRYREIRVLKTRELSLGRAINDRLLRASQR